MEKTKANKISRLTAIIISLIITLVISGVATIIAGLQLQDKESGWFVVATILIGIAVACLTFGVSQMVIGAIYKTKILLAISAVITFLAIIFTLFILAIFAIKWWILLIIALTCIPILLLVIMLVYRKNMVLVFDNEKADYVDYKTREELKKEDQLWYAQENDNVYYHKRKERDEENPQEEEEELPQIKSFK